ncbi:MAG: DNA polymerase/3'-5' exonuclease PolX [Deltaproteobacteria bacterium]|nr:DNA polymerase/3'-5' exonuclease PolX [Deltaproteobacteria bacterium]
MLDRREVARVLREIGTLLQLKGENPFKTRAYETAALRLEELTEERFADLVRDGRLEDLPGIGEAISKKVATLWQTGRLPYHEELRAGFPPGILEMLRVPELGPKKVAVLCRELQLGSLDELAQACRAGRVRELKGFGARSETKILEGILALRPRDQRRPLAMARPVALELAARLRAVPGVRHAEAAGSVRRFRETVADVDIVVAAPRCDPTFDALVASPSVAQIIGRGETKCSVVMRDGLQVDVRVVPEESWATAMHHFTGSKAHHVRLRGIARDRGLTISEYGVERLADHHRLPIASEADLYSALGMAPIPPEMREDTGEVEAALEGRLPRVVEAADVLGYLHVHTRDSDGTATVLQMAQAVRALGGRYLAITDHSRSAGYAGGLDAARLRAQWDAIDAAQEQVPEVRLLRGSEVDILEDGRLDYPAEILDRLDLVVASIHSRFKLDEEAMTRRLLAALDDPHVHVLGHLTGRLIGKRDPYPFQLAPVLEKAARLGVALEINGNPERLDLSADHASQACSCGARLVITSDAHSVAGLSELEYAVATARRGWVRREDVLNCLPPDQFLASLRGARRA